MCVQIQGVKTGNSWLTEQLELNITEIKQKHKRLCLSFTHFIHTFLWLKSLRLFVWSSPQLGKRRRRGRIPEEPFSPVSLQHTATSACSECHETCVSSCRRLTAVCFCCQAAVAVSPGRPEHPTGGERGCSRKSKRRRLAAVMGEQNVGFLPASSLTLPMDPWLEAPLSTPSRSSSSSSSSPSLSPFLTPISEEEVKEVAFTVAGSTVEANHSCLSQRTTASASRSPPPSSDSLSFLTAEERRWLNGEQGNTSTGEDTECCKHLLYVSVTSSHS